MSKQNDNEIRLQDDDMQGQKTQTRLERRFVYRSKYNSNLEVLCSFRAHLPNSGLFAVKHLLEIQDFIRS